MPITQPIDFNAMVNKPTTLAGYGITDASQLSVGQTWQNVTASRALGTTYTNSTGRPILVAVRGISPAGSTSGVHLVVSGVSIPYSSAVSSNPTLTVAIVPNGETYSCNANGCTLGAWAELR